MATNMEILETLAVIAAACDLEIPNATKELWIQIFRSVDEHKLSDAVVEYLARATHRRLPMPGEIFKLISKQSKETHHGDLSGVECDVCDELGLVRTRKPNRLTDGEMMDVMVLCHCPLGEAKLAYLEKERKVGRVGANQGRGSARGG